MTIITRRRLALALAALAVAVLVGVALAVSARSGESPRAERQTTREAAPGTPARFAVLRRARSNLCGLRPQNVATLAKQGRLQGSCCSPMDLHRYTEQVKGLRRYAAVPEIPRDPYDIPVALAKRLLSYKQTIKLTPAQQSTFDRAMKLEGGHGPCCCQCWRWSAFSGQAKYLIARRGYSAQEIAGVWVLEDGCGGASHEHHAS